MVCVGVEVCVGGRRKFLELGTYDLIAEGDMVSLVQLEELSNRYFIL